MKMILNENNELIFCLVKNATTAQKNEWALLGKSEIKNR